jgi:uncharacterized protein YecA (UPF0149 family)
MNTKKEVTIESNNESNDHQHEHVHGPNCNHDHHHDPLKPIIKSAPKVGRNDPCPCGSQKKFKKCCG